MAGEDAFQITAEGLDEGGDDEEEERVLESGGSGHASHSGSEDRKRAIAMFMIVALRIREGWWGSRQRGVRKL